MKRESKIAILDDYLDATRTLACFDTLAGHDVTVFTDHLQAVAPLAERLAPFDALVLIRERTRIDAALLDRRCGPATAHRSRRRTTATGGSAVLWPGTSLHVRLTPDTHGIIKLVDLAAMKPDALLVNTSRAGLVAPGALLTALQAVRPGMAAVDVFDHEPVTGDAEPLLGLENVIATPHIGCVTREEYELQAKLLDHTSIAQGQVTNLRCRRGPWPEMRAHPWEEGRS